MSPDLAVLWQCRCREFWKRRAAGDAGSDARRAAHAARPGGAVADPLRYLPKAAPWLWRFVRASRPDDVQRIAQTLSTLLANSMEQHVEMLREIGASEIVRRTGQLYLYPDEKWLRKDALSWTLRRDHGLRVERLGRGDILALEPEVGPDYSVGLFTPDQGMSINPYRQVTAIASDFARRGGRIVRDRVVAIEVAADRTQAVRGENATYPPIMSSFARAHGPRNCSPARATPSLESQRGYHVTIAAPGSE